MILHHIQNKYNNCSHNAQHTLASLLRTPNTGNLYSLYLATDHIKIRLLYPGYHHPIHLRLS